MKNLWTHVFFLSLLSSTCRKAFLWENTQKSHFRKLIVASKNFWILSEHPRIFSMPKGVNLFVYKLWYGLLNFEFERNYTFKKMLLWNFCNVFSSYAFLFFFACLLQVIPYVYVQLTSFHLKKILMTVVPNLEHPICSWVTEHPLEHF